MRKHLFLGLIGLLLVILAACGGSATAVPAAKQAPAAVAAPAAPAAAAKPAAPAPAAAAAPSAVTLAQVAAKLAGKPGAIYAGDLKQLVGPAPSNDQGFEGDVPLDSLKRHLYIYESDHYKSLLDKAKLTNPTPLVSTGKSFTIQHACINRTLLWCLLMDSYFAPNLLERTKGQVKLVVSSFPELGLAGPDTLRLVSEGTLSMVEIFAGYVAGDLPAIEAGSLYGLYPDQRANYEVSTALIPDLEKLVRESTGGSFVVTRVWFTGNDIFLFCSKKLASQADFKGVKARSFSSAFSDYLKGMGAEAQFLAFAEVYVALERGIVTCAPTSAVGAYGLRWYEVADYMVGPLISFFSTNVVVNKDVWSKLSPDLQQIMLEEGAKFELESLRLAAIQNEVGLQRILKEGIELVEYSPELKDYSYNVAVLQHVIPGWVKRLGGPDAPFVKVFNEKVTPILGLRIEPNGSIVKVPITKVR